MARTVELGFVLGTALVGWLVAVTVTGGWSEPSIILWAAVLTLGATGVLYAAETVRIGS